MPPGIFFLLSGTFFRLSGTSFVSRLPLLSLWYLFSTLWYFFSSLPSDSRRTKLHPLNQKKALYIFSRLIPPPRHLNPLYFPSLNPFSPAWCHLDAKQLKCFSKCISQRFFLHPKGVFTSRTVCFTSQRCFYISNCLLSISKAVFTSQRVFFHLKVCFCISQCLLSISNC